MPKCKNKACSKKYERTHGGIETWCSVDCGMAILKEKREKAYKAETRAMKKARDDADRSLWIKKAQTAFNAYIRARDAGLPCISCGVPDGQGKRNACHYRPAGINTALRFEESNVHGGCERCNTYQSGNLVEYRIGLKRRIGADKVEWLEQNHEIKKWSIDELKAIEAEYKRKLKEITRARL
jgi:hypothetical protein